MSQVILFQDKVYLCSCDKLDRVSPVHVLTGLLIRRDTLRFSRKGHLSLVLTREQQITPHLRTNYQMINHDSKRKYNGASRLINRGMPHHNESLMRTAASTDWLPNKPPCITAAHGSKHLAVMTQTYHRHDVFFDSGGRLSVLSVRSLISASVPCDTAVFHPCCSPVGLMVWTHTIFQHRMMAGQ